KAIETSTYGVIFMGTPHQGVNLLEWAQSCSDGRSLGSLQDDPLLKTLSLYSGALQTQLSQYDPISSRFETVFFYELYGTHYVSPCVPEFSAKVPGDVNTESIGIYKTHIEMVKFPSKKDADYNNIVYQLRRMV
ncbi:hypothetical protein BU17DRAFT_16835, partial [Hysterangium stoloniferum]